MKKIRESIFKTFGLMVLWRFRLLYFVLSIIWLRYDFFVDIKMTTKFRHFCHHLEKMKVWTSKYTFIFFENRVWTEVNNFKIDLPHWMKIDVQLGSLEVSCNNHNDQNDQNNQFKAFVDHDSSLAVISVENLKILKFFEFFKVPLTVHWQPREGESRKQLLESSKSFRL